MRIFKDQFGRHILVKSNKPYYLFRSYFSTKGEPFELLTDLERKEVQHNSFVSIYPSSYEEMKFLMFWFSEFTLEPVQVEREHTEGTKIFPHNLDTPLQTDYLFGILVMPNQFRTFCESLRSLSRRGYRTAYYVKKDRLVVK